MRDTTVNLIFDCDGTLVDSYAAISGAVRALFLRHGIDCDEAEIRRRSLQSSVGRCIASFAAENGLDAGALIEEFRGIDEDLSLITLCPGAGEVLRTERFRCFLFTHRGRTARALMERFGTADAFEEIVDATCGFPRKPDPGAIAYLLAKYGLDREKTYYVGDRRIDIDCGKSAGIGTVFVKTPGLYIDSDGADYTVTCLREIPALPL